MKKPDSIGLMIMGIGLLPVALLMSSLWLQAIVLVASMVLNILAIARSFKEKKKNKL
ncbi:hypothetical protein FLLO111716_08650 [Flavobacterium longum]|uniref:hypothetical protein n=1 Tax=Flavobacterium longum TaxID=1299340 RepID=UPI0039EA0B4A